MSNDGAINTRGKDLQAKTELDLEKSLQEDNKSDEYKQDNEKTIKEDTKARQHVVKTIDGSDDQEVQKKFNKKPALKKKSEFDIQNDDDSDTNEDIRKKENVKFPKTKAELLDVKPATILTQSMFLPDTFEREDLAIEKCRTRKDLEIQSNLLISELEKLQERKKDGYDVSQQYEHLELKFNLLSKKKKLIEKEIEEKKNEKKISNPDNKKFYERRTSNENKEIKIQLPRVETPLLNNENNKEKYIDEIFKSLYKERRTDILFLFHFCSFDCHESSKASLDYLNKKSKEHKHVRFAIGFHDSDSKGNDLTLNLSQFSDKLEFKPSELSSDLLTLREKILNLNWDHKALKIVLNISREDNNIAKNNLISKIFQQKDGVQEFLDSKQIDYVHKKMKITSRISESDIDEILKPQYFLNLITQKFKANISQELYNLKRIDIKSFDEFLIYRKNLSPNVKDPLFSKTNVEKIFYKKKDLEAKIESGSRENGTLYSLNKKKVSKLVHLREYKFIGKSSSEVVWLEELLSREKLIQFLEIHSITSILVDEFNKRCKDYTINIAKACRFKLESYDLYGLIIDNSLEDSANFKKSESSTIALDAFSHFSYEKSHQVFIIHDLRTFQLEKNTFMITEPIIHSLSCKYLSSDLGIAGINFFIKEHECNEICKILNLKKIET